MEGPIILIQQLIDYTTVNESLIGMWKRQLSFPPRLLRALRPCLALLRVTKTYF